MQISPFTSIDPVFEKRVRATFEGMAHWAGTGPRGKYCGNCVFMVKAPQGGSGYRCDKFSRLTGQTGKAAIPRTTRACRHFEQRG